MLSSFFLISLLLTVAWCGPFRASLSTSPQQSLGEEVTCEVTITNTQDADIYLYTRRTPFTPSRAAIFSVTLNGKEVSYDGAYFKMAPLRKDSDTILVPAKTSVSKLLDLSETYPISKPGRYEVKLDTEIYYRYKSEDTITGQPLSSESIVFTVLGGRSVPRPTLGEKYRLIQNGTKQPNATSNKNGTLKFEGKYDDVDEDTAKTAWEEAHKLLGTISAVIDKANGTYVTWFGARDEGRIDTVKGVFLSIEKAMETDNFTLYFHGQECARDDFSYQYFRSPYIYLCPAYFRAQDKFDYNSKLGTIIHSLAVIVSNRQDFPRIYSMEECQALAKDIPLKAIGSAYNYEFFCESLVKRDG